MRRVASTGLHAVPTEVRHARVGSAARAADLLSDADGQFAAGRLDLAIVSASNAIVIEPSDASFETLRIYLKMSRDFATGSSALQIASRQNAFLRADLLNFANMRIAEHPRQSAEFFLAAARLVHDDSLLSAAAGRAFRLAARRDLWSFDRKLRYEAANSITSVLAAATCAVPNLIYGETLPSFTAEKSFAAHTVMALAALGCGGSEALLALAQERTLDRPKLRAAFYATLCVSLGVSVAFGVAVHAVQPNRPLLFASALGAATLSFLPAITFGRCRFAYASGMAFIVAVLLLAIGDFARTFVGETGDGIERWSPALAWLVCVFWRILISVERESRFQDSASTQALREMNDRPPKAAKQG